MPQSTATTDVAKSRDCIVRLERPEEGATRARKVVSRSKTIGGTGKYPSWKMKRMVHFESVHELNAMRLLDADPRVTRFAEQPLIVHYILDGIAHRHFPDIEVHMLGQRELWEVRTDEQAESAEVSRRTALMATGLVAHGFTYRMVKASELKMQPRLGTVREILRYGRKSIGLVERECMRRELVQGAVSTWGDLSNSALGVVRARAVVTRLILEGAVHLPVDRRLDAKTQLWHVEQGVRA